MQLERHLSTSEGDCPLSTVKCPYSIFNCTFVVSDPAKIYAGQAKQGVLLEHAINYKHMNMVCKPHTLCPFLNIAKAIRDISASCLCAS